MAKMSALFILGVKIHQLPEGETGWIAPRAIEVDPEGEAYLNIHESIRSHYDGYHTVKLHRFENEFYVSVDRSAAQWSTNKLTEGKPWVPIKEIEYSLNY